MGRRYNDKNRVENEDLRSATRLFSRPIPNFLGSGLVLNRRVGAVVFYRVDTGLARSCGGIHLAAADDLLIAGQQVEEKLAVCRFLQLVTLIEHTVLAHGLDTVLATAFIRVALAAKNLLTIIGVEAEIDLVVLTGKNLKLRVLDHRVFLMVCDPGQRRPRPRCRVQGGRTHEC